MWEAIAGYVGGKLVDNLINSNSARANAEFQNSQSLDMMRKAPAAQMEGLRAAGLNPMLAYNRLDFPTGSANINYSPSDGFAPGVAALSQAGTAADVGTASAGLMRQQAKTESFRTAVAQNEAIKGNYALMQLAAQIDAAMVVTKQGSGTEALAKLAEPQIRAGLMELRAAFASAKNDAEVYEALNSKAVSVALEVLARVTGSGTAIAGAVDRYRARSQRGDIINLNKE